MAPWAVGTEDGLEVEAGTDVVGADEAGVHFPLRDWVCFVVQCWNKVLM